MNNKEGFRRLIRAGSILAWIVLAICFASAVVLAFSEPVYLLVLGVFGFLSFVALQGLCWIIAGFSGLAREEDGLIRWADIREFRKNKSNSQTALTSPKPEVRGIAGWLAFFMLALILSAIRSVMSYVESRRIFAESAPWILESSYGIAFTAICAIAFMLFVLAFYLLLKFRFRSTIPKVILAIWIGGPVCAVADLLAAKKWIPNLPDLNGDDARQLMGNLMFAIIWTLYLLLSRRVKNTYV